MNQLAIHVYHPSAAPGIGRLVRAAAPERRVVVLEGEAALAEALPTVEVLFAPMPPRTGWASARALRLLQVAGAGVDHFLPSPDLPEGVVVAGARGVFGAEVAEHALMMLLALRHELPTFLEAQRRHAWTQRPVAKLGGSSLVVLGLGEIGGLVARYAATLGVRVRGVSRSGRAREGLDAAFPTHRVLDAVHGADAVVVCVPRTAETVGLVDARLLGALADRAVLVDVSRGGVVDVDALLDALATERLAGAALDVFEDEPLRDDSPLWDAPGVVVTPHVAGYGRRYVERAIEVLVDNVARLERGEPLHGRVDRALAY